jgi:uncharacterized membrane protein YhaH (DUF805 family)
MSFGEAIQSVFRNYAEFTGRATRPEFWWWALFNLLVVGALNLFNVIRIGDNAYLGSLLAGLWGIAVLLPNLAVAVRRLRDAGYGWGHLFWILVPIAGIFVLITLRVQPKGDAGDDRRDHLALAHDQVVDPDERHAPSTHPRSLSTAGDPA